ncbi:FGGY-family carbohydrate kinase [uncultured Victivallis sp.]|uniref:FGGY-family carbohydrate kinase n=1 Tax=uncultured Victivallis sp. TaxID=354118 RepID=UPI002596E712|nr:FGGY-family carbohydrate kinase [uncultured Victivallis sp.]
MSFLGIDIGSSQAKAVVFDENGSELASAYRKYAYTTAPGGHIELDSKFVLESVLQVIGECAAAVAAADPVRSLCASSQGEAFTAVGENGKILTPAMISGDSRAVNEVAEFVDAFGLKKLYVITGHTPSPMFTLGKLLWLRKHQPELFSRSTKFLCFEDLLCFRLTGRAAIGYPLAGRTLLFDVVNHVWNDEILDAAGIEKSKLADPLPAGTAVAKIAPEMVRELRLAPGAVWVAGGHDQVVGAYGCGVTEPGTAMFAAGSVECMVSLLPERVFSYELCNVNLCTYDYVLPGVYATLAYSLTGANMQEYYIREFCGGDYKAVLEAMPEKPTGLLALPYLTPSGTPWFDTVTPACIYGGRFDTTRPEVLKALWEGIAFELKLNSKFLDQNGITLDRLIASGGGLRSPAVVQLHADILGLPISSISVSETGCRGAALLARRAVEPDFVPPPVKVVKETMPNPENAALYSEKFKQWESFSQLVRNFAHGNRII